VKKKKTTSESVDLPPNYENLNKRTAARREVRKNLEDAQRSQSQSGTESNTEVAKVTRSQRQNMKNVTPKRERLKDTAQKVVDAGKKILNIESVEAKKKLSTVSEDKVRLVKNGHTYQVALTWRGKTYMIQMFVPSVSRPTRQDVEKEIQKIYPDAKVLSFLPKAHDPANPTVMVGEENLNEDDMKGMSVKSGHKRPTKSGAGMTAKGVAAYRRRNPGSKLKTAVTGKVKKGSKDANRRKSYCARSAGQMKKFPKAAKDPNSRLRQARRRWKC